MSENVEYLLRQQSKVLKPKTLIKVVRQQQRLEKRKLKAETRKAEIEAVAGVSKELISSIGKAAQGLFSNQIAGTAFFITAATLLYPAWFPMARIAVSTITADLANAWRTQIVPNAEDLLRDTPLGGAQPDYPKAKDPVPGPRTVTLTRVYWWVDVSGRGASFYNTQATAEQGFMLAQAVFFLTGIPLGGIKLWKRVYQQYSDGYSDAVDTIEKQWP